eukprot:g11865.t1
MTVDMDVLLKHEVIPSRQELSKVNPAKLEAFAREVVELYSAEVRRIYQENDGAFGMDIPTDFWSRRPVALDPKGRPAMSVFAYHADLTWLQQPMHLFDDQRPVFFAGDALREPFWPMGEGCSRGFMGALDTVWAVRCWAKGLRGQSLLQLRKRLFDLASKVDPANYGKDVFLPFEHPVPLAGFHWLSALRISWPAWGLDGRRRPTTYAFTVDPKTRYISYEEPSEPLDLEDAPSVAVRCTLCSRYSRHARICFLARLEGVQGSSAGAALRAAYAAAKSSLGPERLLWHGTSWDCVPNIVRHGFNRAYAFNARHGSKLGRGVYFADDPGYALRFAGKCQTRAVLLAGVLPGRFTRGKEGLLEAPAMPAMPGLRFDSTCDDAPRVFCVFKDFQALPLYLLQVAM